jgi:hypothetical protein
MINSIRWSHNNKLSGRAFAGDFFERFEKGLVMEGGKIWPATCYKYQLVSKEQCSPT